MACVNEWSLFSFSLIIFHNRKREHNQYSFVLVEKIIVEVLIKKFHLNISSMLRFLRLSEVDMNKEKIMLSHRNI